MFIASYFKETIEKNHFIYNDNGTQGPISPLLVDHAGSILFSRDIKYFFEFQFNVKKVWYFGDQINKN